jgi:chaperonin GroEL
MQDGVVPGGATLLVHAARLDISPLFATALESTFKKLFDNAAEPADYRLKQIQLAPDAGYGFNLRAMTDEPIDLAGAGIWDATRAVIQTIENAASAAGALLTVGALITPVEDESQENAK